MEYLLSLYLENRNIRILINIHILVAIVTIILINIVMNKMSKGQKKQVVKNSKIKIDEESTNQFLEATKAMRINIIIMSMIISVIPILNIYYMYRYIDNFINMTLNRIREEDIE